MTQLQHVLEQAIREHGQMPFPNSALKMSMKLHHTPYNMSGKGKAFARANELCYMLSLVVKDLLKSFDGERVAKYPA